MFRRTTIKGCMVILALLAVAVLAAVWWLGRPPLQPADRVAAGIVAFSWEDDLQVRRLRLEETPGGDRVRYKAKLDDGSEAVFDVEEEVRSVLGELLLKYAEYGLAQFEIPAVLKIPPISHRGNVREIAALFGGPAELRRAVHQLQNLLYES